MLGIKEIDHFIFLHLDIVSLNRFIMTHKNISSIYDGEFWKAKIKHDNLPLYLTTNTLNVKTFNQDIKSYNDGLRIYNVLYTVKSRAIIKLLINDIEYNRKVDKSNGIINLEIVDLTLLDYILPYDILKSLTKITKCKIILKYNNNNTYDVIFLNVTHHTTIQIFKTTFNIEKIIILLYHVEYVIQTGNIISVYDDHYLRFYISNENLDFHLNNPYCKLNNVHKRLAMVDTFNYINDIDYLENLLYKVNKI
jgi:hypothetical protein